MKKTICLIIVFCLLLCMLMGCNNPPDGLSDTLATFQTVFVSGPSLDAAPDVWDGSIADSFDSGDGSQTNPYVIKKASQLAFLAQQTNLGVNYNGKFFSLIGNLDLNNQEWTPIGNGTYNFSGIFNGNNYTISNLNVCAGVSYAYHYAIDHKSMEYSIGLFGRCVDATLQNLKINGAKITIQNTVDRDGISAGVLVGTFETGLFSKLSGIRVTNSQIIADTSLQQEMLVELNIGGVVGKAGYLRSVNPAGCQIDRIESNVTVSIENSRAAASYIGGMFGAINLNAPSKIENCASFISLQLTSENCYIRDVSMGAFGSISNGGSDVSVKGLFSKVTVNKIYDTFHGYPAYSAFALGGITTYYQTYRVPAPPYTGGYRFENLFGYVEQIDPDTKTVQTSTDLFDSASLKEVYVASNCEGRSSLPQNHDLDANVWDLTDLSNPKLK